MPSIESPPFYSLNDAAAESLSPKEMHSRWLDLLIWVTVCDIYERRIKQASEELEAARLLSGKHRKKAARTIWLRTYHALSGRALSDDPYRFTWEPYRLTLAVSQELRAAALEQDLLALSNAAKEMLEAA